MYGLWKVISISFNHHQLCSQAFIFKCNWAGLELKNKHVHNIAHWFYYYCTNIFQYCCDRKILKWRHIISYYNLYRNIKLHHSRWLSFISFLYVNNCHSIMGGRNRFLYFCIPVILSYSLSFHYSYLKQRLETIFLKLQSILSSRWTQNNVTMKYNMCLFPKSLLIIFL